MKNDRVILREAMPTDAEKMLAYVHRLSEEPDINIPLAPGEFDITLYEEEMILAEYIATENCLFLIAEAGEWIVGALNCRGNSRMATRHAVTLGISIDREWRNLGIGNALMTEAIEWARKTDIVKRIELTVYARNKIAIRLYEKYGFEVEGRRRDAVCQGGRYKDDLVMALLL